MRNRLWAGLYGLAVLAVLGSGVAGCTPERGSRAVIEVDAPVAQVDQAVHIRIGGLAPGEQVTVGAQAVDALGRQWRARATFRADPKGVVDLDTATPKSGGVYRSPDGMGLFWSMNPRTGTADHTLFVPPDAPTRGYEVTLTAAVSGRALVTRPLTRVWCRTGVTSREITPAADGISGQLFLPAPGTPRHPAVLVFGGSEGGNVLRPVAALLASHGYPALAIAYFKAPGLPDTLEDIPLEYFATAARLLAAQPGVDPDRLVTLGYSRGTEAALLLAQNHPDLFHGTIVYAPSAQVHPGLPDPANAAWTKDGKPVTQVDIPLDRVDGPVLSIAGEADLLWSSISGARQIAGTLDAAGTGHPHQELVFPMAGHGVGVHPYVAQGTRVLLPDGIELDLGGTRAADAAARAEGWPKVLALLASLIR